MIIILLMLKDKLLDLLTGGRWSECQGAIEVRATAPSPSGWKPTCTF